MRRPFLTAFLVVGAVLGYSSGIFHLVHHGSFAHGDGREAFERHIADVCTESALRAAGKSSAVAPAPR
jgi:hypothetical protein